MPTPGQNPEHVLAIPRGYVEKTGRRPVIAIGRNAFQEYRACVLDEKGELVFAESVVPEEIVTPL
jgi:hypothetical protein